MSAMLSHAIGMPAVRRAALIALLVLALALLLVVGWHGASSARVATMPSLSPPVPIQQMSQLPRLPQLPQAPHADSQLEQINALLLAEQLSEVQVRASSNGYRVLTGWVPHAGDLARLKRRLGQYKLSFAIGVGEEVARYLSEHLSELRIDATVSHQQGGTFRVQGRGNDQPAFDQALARIVQNLPQGATVDAHYEALSSSKANSTPATKVPPPKPDRHLLTGIDGVVAAPRSSYLTAGSHYVFRGGTLRDGAVVLAISTERIEVSRAGEATTIGAQLAGVKHEAQDRK